MSEEMYQVKMNEIDEIPAADDLLQGDIEVGGIILTGAGEYKRGEILMSNGENKFTKATLSGLSSAYELCVLADDIELEADQTAEVTGYFFGAYKESRLILPDEATMTSEIYARLRKHGIYVR